MAFRTLRPVGRFSRLQWQLARSFIFASLGVALALLVLLAVTIIVCFYLTPLLAFALASQSQERVAPRVARYITANDHDGLSAYLVGLCGSMRKKESPSPSDGYFTFSLALDSKRGHRLLVATTDTQGQVIASQALKATPPKPGTALKDILNAEERAVLDSALKGESEVEHLSLRLPDSTATAIVPVKQGKKVVGVFFIRLYVPLDPGLIFQTLGQNALQVAASVVAITLLPASFGGYLASRSLTRRLGSVVDAAEAWGHGDFTRTAPTTAQDELGVFAQRLNQIRGELEETLRLRQQIAGLQERQRIARDLHDTVKQEVFALTMHLSALHTLAEGDTVDPAKTLNVIRTRLANVEGLAVQVQQALTGIIQELQPGTDTPAPAETNASLSVTLRQLIDTWTQHSGIEVDLSVKASPLLPPEARQNLLRITREALANIARHAEADTVVVSLSRMPGTRHWLLYIRDNGKGFVSTEGKLGMGMQNMRQRATSLPSGDFELQTAPGDGTILRITFEAEAYDGD